MKHETPQAALWKVIDQGCQDNWDQYYDHRISAYIAIIHDSTASAAYFMVSYDEPVDIHFHDDMRNRSVQ